MINHYLTTNSQMGTTISTFHNNFLSPPIFVVKQFFCKGSHLAHWCVSERKHVNLHLPPIKDAVAGAGRRLEEKGKDQEQTGEFPAE